MLGVTLIEWFHGASFFFLGGGWGLRKERYVKFGRERLFHELSTGYDSTIRMRMNALFHALKNLLLLGFPWENEHVATILFQFWVVKNTSFFPLNHFSPKKSTYPPWNSATRFPWLGQSSGKGRCIILGAVVRKNFQNDSSSFLIGWNWKNWNKFQKLKCCFPFNFQPHQLHSNRFNCGNLNKNQWR